MLKRHGALFLAFLFLCGIFLFFPGISYSSSNNPESEMIRKTKPPEAPIPKYFVPPPPFSEGIFPCSQCHADMPVNTKRRKLVDMHSEKVLKHAGPRQWCLDCHDAKNRDKLHLIDGELIDFDQVYYLCGQCHGTIFRDWKAGVHGKRTGEWNGKKLYRLCTQCHDPHQPRFKPLKPKRPPERPSDIR